MSSCLSGGTGRAYGFNLENIITSPSTTSSITSHSSSPSSTLSESSNSPRTVSNRKPRTPRKRPNQTYNEAAALLSTACPTIFSTKYLTKNTNNQSKFFNDPPELLLPFQVIERPVKVKSFESKFGGNLTWNWKCGSNVKSMEFCEGYEDDFDTESMLYEEIEEGIDSIMGNSNSIMGSYGISNDKSCLGFDFNFNFNYNYNTCYGYPIGGNLEFNYGFGLRNGVRALKNVDEGNWWNFPAVNVMTISPAPVKLKKAPVEKMKKLDELMKLNPKKENFGIENGHRLLLKLNYDDVLNAWSDKGSPLPEEMSGSESPGGDIHAKLAQIDLFSENGGLREVSVTRYKEKKHTRLFSKKIRYQIRKVNTDQRPRSKGRFVRRPNSPTCEET